jgi:hypothetical protein
LYSPFKLSFLQTENPVWSAFGKETRQECNGSWASPWNNCSVFVEPDKNGVTFLDLADIRWPSGVFLEPLEETAKQSEGKWHVENDG